MFTEIAAAATASAIIAVMTTSAGTKDVCSPAREARCNLHLKGTFLVHAVDQRRVLVAVDTYGEGSIGDGRIDHLFLITAPAAPRERGEGTLREVGTMVGLRQGVVSILAETLYIQLRAEGEAARLLSLENVQWAHYWGYGVAGASIAELTQASQAEKCDHVAGSCWGVNGFRFTFPS